VPLRRAGRQDCRAGCQAPTGSSGNPEATKEDCLKRCRDEVRAARVMQPTEGVGSLSAWSLPRGAVGLALGLMGKTVGLTRLAPRGAPDLTPNLPSKPEARAAGCLVAGVHNVRAVHVPDRAQGGLRRLLFLGACRARLGCAVRGRGCRE